MKSKKGFTLVELLAVIAILAILVVIALPNVIDMFQGAKKGTFKTEVQQVIRQAESTWVLDGGGDQTYWHCADATTSSGHDSLSLQGTELNYYVVISADGKFTTVAVSTPDYAFSGTNVISSSITDAQIFASSVSAQVTSYNTANTTAKTGCK